LISVSTSFAGIGDSGLVRKMADGFMAVFLLVNLVIRFSSIFYYTPYNGYIAVFLGCVVLACVWVVVFQRFLKVYLFIFGFSFFLFGFGSFEIQSRIFELIVTCVSTALFLINCGNLSCTLHPAPCTLHPASRLNRTLVFLILCYVVLSLFSLLLLPVRQIFRDLWFFGYPDGLFYMFRNPPDGIFYPVVAVLRLMLFVVLAVQISRNTLREEFYKSIFSGIFSGAVFCAFIGLLDFYGVISLKWYRFGTINTPGVLHSTFLSRNWLAEFILTVVPFVLIGFMSTIKGLWWKVALFSSLVICELALILAGARAGWVSYPLILFICWLFSYFSKEGGFESFRFGWKDLVKVAISVPITIAVSFLLIFQVLMPLSDYLGEKTGTKGVQANSKASTAYLQSRASGLLKGSKGRRDYTWGEGFNVGRERPFFGMGYESFNWNENILAKTPDTYSNKFHSRKKDASIYQTPHSIFFQLFVSGGIVGLCLWMMIVGYTLLVLILDLIRNKRLLNIPVIISIISFHIYGIFQSMQYIPMIWSLIFLSLGYAMTVDEGVMPVRFKRVMGVFVKVSVVLVVIGFFVYVSNFESRSLAQKYGMRIYAKDQARDRFAGFFEISKRWRYAGYRWFSGSGVVYVGGDGGRVSDDRRQTTDDGRQTTEGGGLRVVALEFYCWIPVLEEEPVVLKVIYDGRVLDEVVFSEKKTGYSVTRKYELPVGSGEEKELLLEVSRTWTPHEVLKNFDRRELGIGVKELSSKVKGQR
jgi:O-antigen ligase